MTRIIVICLFAMQWLATSAFAGGRYDHVVQLEVRHGWTESNGRHIAAFHLSLAPGWKTYWRAPGDAGIPPVFQWSGSRNLGQVAIDWPTPVVFEVSGFRSVGYKDDLVIPLFLKPNQSGREMRVRGTLELGICREVCIPYQLKFDQTIRAGHTQPDPVIAAALASRPLSAQEAGVRQARCTFQPTNRGVRITASIVMPSAGGAEFAVIEPGDPSIWASEATTTREGNRLTVQADLEHANAASFALDRSRVRITVLGTRHAADIKGC